MAESQNVFNKDLFMCQWLLDTHSHTHTQRFWEIEKRFFGFSTFGKSKLQVKFIIHQIKNIVYESKKQKKNSILNKE